MDCYNWITKKLDFMITLYQKTVKDNEIKVVDKLSSGILLYVENPNESDLDRLENEFNLERGHINDAIDIFEAPRLEVEGNDVYVYARVPDVMDDGQIITVPILIILRNDYCVIVAKSHYAVINQFFKNKINFATTQKARLFIQLFLEVNYAYSAYLNQIIKQSRSSIVDINKIENKDIVQLITYEAVLNDFMSSLIPLSGVLQNVFSGKYLKLFSQDNDFMEDLLLENGQIIERCRSSLKHIVNIRESYSTIMTNNLNRTIKLLTSLTVIMIVPTIISGFFGMNVVLPFSDHPLAFYFILFFTLALIFILITIFIRNRWV